MSPDTVQRAAGLCLRDLDHARAQQFHAAGIRRKLRVLADRAAYARAFRSASHRCCSASACGLGALLIGVSGAAHHR